MPAKKELSDFGLIGLGAMGQNIARNVESRGNRVSVYNRSGKKTDAFMKQFGGGNFVPSKTYKAFVASLSRPRKIMLMVKAGAPVDAVLKNLTKHLQKGDVVIDGGNEHYKQTQRREKELKKKGILYVGCGVSGGEEGALHGPSLMPGGSKQAWRRVKKILESIAAKDFSGGQCVTHIGSDGAGHYVKMVHNGIEYGIMQLMAETYSLLRNVYKMPAPKIAGVFERFHRGKLGSYLFEIAVPVLNREDEKKGECCLIYNILDSASQKGTGKWASLDALARGVAIPTITQAVYARYVSGEKEIRVKLNKKYPHKHLGRTMSAKRFEPLLRDALHSAIISIFAQGYHLMSRASEQEKWDIDFAEVSRIWEGGCIIRAKMLRTFHEAYLRDGGKNSHLFLLPEVQALLKKDVKKLRRLVGDMTGSRVALPGFASSLFYYEAMSEERLPANLIQALRDYFGAHTYERIDRSGSFHTDWQ